MAGGEFTCHQIMKPVVMYGTGACAHCRQARYLLKTKGVAFDDIRVDEEPILRIEMTHKCGRFAVPQIWIGGQHIGGCSELTALDKSGELDRLLNE